jgi:uncharacterized membrane protein
MKTSPWAELPHWLVLLAQFAWAAWAWPALPDRLPVHWNMAGEPDRFGGKLEAVLLVPLIAVGIYLLLLVMPLVARDRLADPAAALVFRVARLAVTLLIAGVYAVTQLLLFRHPLRGSAAAMIVAMVGLVFASIGIALLRAGPGVSAAARVPWPLSPEARARTQRLAARLLVAIGAASVVAAAVAPRQAFFVLGGGAAVLAVTATLHTYLAWRAESRS